MKLLDPPVLPRCTHGQQPSYNSFDSKIPEERDLYDG